MKTFNRKCYLHQLMMAERKTSGNRMKHLSQTINSQFSQAVDWWKRLVFGQCGDVSECARYVQQRLEMLARLFGHHCFKVLGTASCCVV